MSKPLNTGIPNSHHSDTTQLGCIFLVHKGPGEDTSQLGLVPGCPLTAHLVVCDELLQQKMEERVGTPIYLHPAGSLQTQGVTISMVRAMSHSLLY